MGPDKFFLVSVRWRAGEKINAGRETAGNSGRLFGTTRLRGTDQTSPTRCRSRTPIPHRFSHRSVQIVREKVLVYHRLIFSPFCCTFASSICQWQFNVRFVIPQIFSWDFLVKIMSRDYYVSLKNVTPKFCISIVKILMKCEVETFLWKRGWKVTSNRGIWSIESS